MKKNSTRMIRINEEIMKELNRIIREDLKDPRVVSHLTTVLKVDTTPDLKYCKVFVSVFGDEEEKSETIEGLKNSAGHIRSELARTINLRNTPKPTFVLDDSLEYGDRISKLLESVKKDADDETAN